MRNYELMIDISSANLNEIIRLANDKGYNPQAMIDKFITEGLEKANKIWQEREKEDFATLEKAYSEEIDSRSRS